MPTSGFLGTRADFLIDAVLLFFIAVPFVMYYVVSLPSRGAHRMHRNLQGGLLLLMALAVLFLELSLRSDSTKEAIAASAFAGTRCWSSSLRFTWRSPSRHS